MWPVLKGLSLCSSEGYENILKLDRNKELLMGKRMDLILPRSCCEYLGKAAPVHGCSGVGGHFLKYCSLIC